MAVDTPLEGPEFFHAPFLRGSHGRALEPTDHEVPCGTLTGVTIHGPVTGHSRVSAAVEHAGIASFRDSSEYLLVLQFNAGERGAVDLRPETPLVIQW